MAQIYAQIYAQLIFSEQYIRKVLLKYIKNVLGYFRKRYFKNGLEENYFFELKDLFSPCLLRQNKCPLIFRFIISLHIGLNLWQHV